MFLSLLHPIYLWYSILEGTKQKDRLFILCNQTSGNMEYNIKHNELKNRFETEVEGKIALVDYRVNDGVYVVTHTEVPKELEGRGIAAALTKYLLDYVRENGLKVHPVCPYTKVYIQKHQEYNDLLA